MDNLYLYRHHIILSLAVLVVVGVVYTSLSGSWCPPAPPCEPEQHVVTTSLPLLEVVQGNLPPPMPNQLRAGRCDPDRAEEEIEGGCWIRTKTRPTCSSGSCTCPAGKQWYSQGACYVPAMERVPRPGVALP